MVLRTTRCCTVRPDRGSSEALCVYSGSRMNRMLINQQTRNPWLLKKKPHLCSSLRWLRVFPPPFSSFIPEPSARLSRLFCSPTLSFLPLLPCFPHLSLFIRSYPTAVRPWGVQMCQLISFFLSAGSLPLVQLGQVREPAEQTQSDTNRSKRKQQHATYISSSGMGLLN